MALTRITSSAGCSTRCSRDLMSSALSPAVIAAIRDLELAARLVVEGTRAGGHRSPLHGYSAEFQQHRPYRAGDDLKYLDWKLLARTDRLYTRQFRETTSMSVMLVLDASASMAFPPKDLSKLRYAQIMAASLAWLIIEQGDAVGMMTMADGRLIYVPARGGRPHLRALIARIEKLEPAGAWDPHRVIMRSAELLDRRGVVVVISDFYDEENAARRAMKNAQRHGHDIAMVQIVSPAELDFPYRGATEFEDLESGERRVVDAATAAKQYHAAMGAFLARCRDEAVRDGIDYALLSTAVPPERGLREYLLRRGASHASHQTIEPVAGR
jgi:uncharacterized protein (DUF58 family)